MDGVWALPVADALGLPGAEETVREYMDCSREAASMGFREGATPRSILEWYAAQQDALDLCSFFAFDKGEVVGLLVARVFFYDHLQERFLSVDSIFVREAFRRNGRNLGGQMMEKLRDLARHMGLRGIYHSARSGTRLERAYSRLYRHVDSIFFEEV